MKVRITMHSATHATVHITRHRFLRLLGLSDEDFEVHGDEYGTWRRDRDGRLVAVSVNLERKIEAAWRQYVDQLAWRARAEAVRGGRHA